MDSNLRTLRPDETHEGSAPVKRFLDLFRRPFVGSQAYWERRYARGGNSGVGSYAKFAEFKAEVLNDFVAKHEVGSVIELGCGDGNQLELARYPRYIGLDVSPTAVEMCRVRFASDSTKQFGVMSDYEGDSAELALSLDVIYHLVEDEVFDDYMETLFRAAKRFVIVYASDTDETPLDEADHVRHRKFTEWIDSRAPEWRLMERIPNRYPHEGDYKTGSFSDFYLYAKGVTHPDAP
jgi:SAM-dependent methyltransferase